ncbi:MAG: HNH endonuclease [Mycobacteriaceae bacterium]|nr:HNH endonuclease [Mycobacteriaceae bacterium]
MSRLDRYGEPIEDGELPLALPGRRIRPLREEPIPAGVAVAERRCGLCGCLLARGNLGQICAECRVVVHNLIGRPVEERWRDHPDGEHVVSERGRVARLLNVDRSHRYPRISVGGVKRYLHDFVAAAWHGPRPEGALVLHFDDDPQHPAAANLRYGSHVDNYDDARRNGRIKKGTA